jgi:hypothetical protein
MEKYSGACRLVMCCSNVSKVMEPVRSRCLCVRVPGPRHEEVMELLQVRGATRLPASALRWSAARVQGVVTRSAPHRATVPSAQREAPARAARVRPGAPQPGNHLALHPSTHPPTRPPARVTPCSTSPRRSRSRCRLSWRRGWCSSRTATCAARCSASRSAR